MPRTKAFVQSWACSPILHHPYRSILANFALIYCDRRTMSLKEMQSAILRPFSQETVLVPGLKFLTKLLERRNSMLCRYYLCLTGSFCVFSLGDRSMSGWSHLILARERRLCSRSRQVGWRDLLRFRIVLSWNVRCRQRFDYLKQETRCLLWWR